MFSVVSVHSGEGCPHITTTQICSNLFIWRPLPWCCSHSTHMETSPRTPPNPHQPFQSRSLCSLYIYQQMGGRLAFDWKAFLLSIKSVHTNWYSAWKAEHPLSLKGLKQCWTAVSFWLRAQNFSISWTEVVDIHFSDVLCWFVIFFFHWSCE